MLMRKEAKKSDKMMANIFKASKDSDIGDIFDLEI